MNCGLAAFVDDSQSKVRYMFMICVVFSRNREFAPFYWRFHKENKNDMTKVAGLGLVLKGNGHLMYLLQIASCIRTESHNLPLILV